MQHKVGKHPKGCDEGDKEPDHGKEGGEGVGEGDKGPDHGDEGGDVGAGDGDKDPEVGAGEDDKDPEVGTVGDDPAHIVSEALLCFNEKHIYSKCQESYRLTESGELHVPSEHIHEFCAGPCLEETNLVLHCLDGIMDHFLFFNKATTKDVKDIVVAGCHHGGELDVAEHTESDGGGGEGIGRKAAVHALFGVVLTILGQVFLV